MAESGSIAQCCVRTDKCTLRALGSCERKCDAAETPDVGALLRPHFFRSSAFAIPYTLSRATSHHVKDHCAVRCRWHTHSSAEGQTQTEHPVRNHSSIVRLL